MCLYVQVSWAIGYGTLGIGAMDTVCLAAAHKVWTWLVGLVAQWGWRDCVTCSLFALWGPNLGG